MPCGPLQSAQHASWFTRPPSLLPVVPLPVRGIRCGMGGIPGRRDGSGLRRRRGFRIWLLSSRWGSSLPVCGACIRTGICCALTCMAHTQAPSCGGVRCVPRWCRTRMVPAGPLGSETPWPLVRDRGRVGAHQTRSLYTHTRPSFPRSLGSFVFAGVCVMRVPARLTNGGLVAAVFSEPARGSAFGRVGLFAGVFGFLDDGYVRVELGASVSVAAHAAARRSAQSWRYSRPAVSHGPQ